MKPIVKYHKIEDFNYLNVAYNYKLHAYHVGLNAYSDGREASWPTSHNPSAVIQRGGRVGLFSVLNGKLVAYKSYI